MITRRPSTSHRNYNASAQKACQDATFRPNCAKPFVNHQNTEKYKASYGTPVKSARNPIGTIRNYDEKYQIQNQHAQPASHLKYPSKNDSWNYRQPNQNLSGRILQKVSQNYQKDNYCYPSKAHLTQKLPQTNLQSQWNHKRPSRQISNEHNNFDRFQYQKINKQQLFRTNLKYENGDNRRQLSDITNAKINLPSQKNLNQKPWDPLQSEVQKTNFMRSRQNRKDFLKQAQEKLQCYSQQFQSGKPYKNSIYIKQQQIKQPNKRLGFKQEVLYRKSQRKMQLTPQNVKRGDEKFQSDNISHMKRNSIAFLQHDDYSKMTPREKSVVLRQQLQKSRNKTSKGYNFHNQNQLNRSVDQSHIRNVTNFASVKHDSKTDLSNEKACALFKQREQTRKQGNYNGAFNGLNKSINNNFNLNRNNVDYGQSSFSRVFEKGFGVENQKTIGKLKKINELNQKINQRIKRIIDNFENKNVQ